MTASAAKLEPLPSGSLISERYAVRGLLGRGGMSFVYQVRDRVTGRDVALKQLVLPPSSNAASLGVLFEREFHTLTDLRHPHVIAVFDYAVDATGPFYTMELLDGGDLRERVPIAWRDACKIFFDVASSIALLHSRRLLHRDITPRNIRCTQDGRAKLIDFGAMAPMSAGASEVIGTPPFVAPETVHRSAVDARTDLFSLGATLYFALTGRMAYPARTFAEVMLAWRTKVLPPSKLTPGVPAALDDLVLAMIDPEPARRPQNAFEVMERLAAIAGLNREESPAISAAYLAAPTLVGRDAPLRELREQLTTARLSRAGGLLIHGEAGVGRSRMLDAFALEAKTLGFTVLRAAAAGAAEPFAVPRALTRHLLDTLPSLVLQKLAPTLLEPDPGRDDPQEEADGLRLKLKLPGDAAVDPEPAQDAFCELWTRVSQRYPLLIAVDDVHRIDASSAAVLAAFLDRMQKSPICVALSSDTADLTNDTVHALVRRCRVMELQPLTAAETQALLGSLFGEVPNLALLSRELHQVGRGNPRQTIDLAQYLVDQDVVRYGAGTWTLPDQLSADALPSSFADALRTRALRLSDDARVLLEAHSLAFHESLTDEQYRRLLPAATPQRVEHAITELLALQALANDGPAYLLANRLWAPAIVAGMSPSQVVERHCALAAMYELSSKIAFIFHAFGGQMDREGIRALNALNESLAAQADATEMETQNISKMMTCYPRALEAASRLGFSARQINELRRWNLAGATTVQDAEPPESSRQWLAQLEHDTGLDLYRADPDPDTNQRLMRALGNASQRHLALPADERVYSVQEALPLLAEYVVFCIMIGGRCNDATLVTSLPPLLEPFRALSPTLEAIWSNAVATSELVRTGELNLARERWLAVLAKVDHASTAEMKYAREIGNAIAYAVGLVEAQLGLPSASTWADRLEKDPRQRIASLQLRRIVRLEHGDAKGAERLRREIEVLSLQTRSHPMFKTLLSVELTACFNAGDLVGIQEVIDRMRPIAMRLPGWLPYYYYAEGAFQLVRGDYHAAQQKFQDCMGLTPKATLSWYAGITGLAEAFLALDEPARARDVLQEALQIRAAYAGSAPPEIVRPLALAEAKLGSPHAAKQLEALLAEQQRLGASGVRLGRSYEARAQIALWEDDGATFARYAALTAREYRYGAGSALGSRYERLMNEARRRGIQPMAAPASLAPIASTVDRSAVLDGDIRTRLLVTVSRESTGAGRARAALELICAAHNAERGHLYVCSGASLIRAASVGDPPPVSDMESLRDFVLRAGSQTEDEKTVTRDSSIEASSVVLRAANVQYELLALSCVVEGEAQVVGVAVVETRPGTVDAVRSLELRQAIAHHMIESGQHAYLDLRS